MDVCPNKPVKCPYQQFGCNIQLSNKEMEDHLRSPSHVALLVGRILNLEAQNQTPQERKGASRSSKAPLLAPKTSLVLHFKRNKHPFQLPTRLNAANMETCGRCREEVYFKSMKMHAEEFCERRLLSCPYCESGVEARNLEASIQQMEQQVGHANVLKAHIEELKMEVQELRAENDVLKKAVYDIEVAQ
ncbi:hypothetical protein V5799_026262, partial [Amblyomma americanum]